MARLRKGRRLSAISKPVPVWAGGRAHTLYGLPCEERIAGEDNVFAPQGDQQDPFRGPGSDARYSSQFRDEIVV